MFPLCDYVCVCARGYVCVNILVLNDTQSPLFILCVCVCVM